MVVATALVFALIGPANATATIHTQQPVQGPVETPSGPGDSSRPQPDSPTISILSQSSWVSPTGTFELALDIQGASPTDRLDLAVFPRITRPTQLDDTIRGEDLGRPLNSDIHPFELNAYPPATATDTRSGIQASIPVTDDRTPPFGIQLSQAGVYPVRITVTDPDDNPLASVVTHLLRLPADGTRGADTPLAFSLIVPIHAPPALQPDGTTVFDAAALQRIDAALAAIGSHPSVDLTYAPTPETLDGLAYIDASNPASATHRLPAFTRLARAQQILGQSFVDIDLGSWVASPPPADTELNEQLLTGAEVVDERVGVRPDTLTVLTDPTITAETLTRFRFTGTNQLVIPESQLEAVSGSDPAIPFQTFDVTDSAGQAIRSVATNDSLIRRLTETTDPVLNGHLVLADLALTWLTTGTDPRGTVLSVPTELAVPVETYDAILDGLTNRDDAGGAPMVSAVTIDDLFRVTSTAPGRAGDPLIRPYTADPPGSVGSLAQDAAETRAQVASYRTMLRTDTTSADGLDRRILVAEARGLDQATRDDYLDGVTHFIDAQFDGIVTPDDQRVTLTEERGELPVTVENHLDYEVEVEVEVSSVKLEFPEGDARTVVLAPNSSTRVDVPVASRTTGAFPVQVSVRTPDHQLLIAAASFTVRSTAISGIGLILSISAGAFLLLWWAMHFRKTRRARQLVESSHPTLR